MLIRRNLRGKASQRGFTLLEVMIAAAILSVVGLGLTQGLQLANQTNDTVQDRSDQNRELRKAVELLRAELKSTRSDLLNIVADGDGNHQVSLQVPVDGLGATSWGAYDRKLGSTPAEQQREDWIIRYLALPDADGGRDLVRQVIDDTGAIRLQETLVRGLLDPNDPDGPSFLVQATGEVWETRLATKHGAADGSRIDSFHVRLRNQSL